MAITGIVDAIKFPNAISGWAYAHEEPSAPVEIYLTKDGHRIQGSFVWGNPREWHWINKGKIGYYFRSDISFSTELFSSGRIRIFADAGEHGVAELAFDDGMSRFLKAIDAFSAGRIPVGFSTNDFAEIVKWIKFTGIKLDGDWYEKFISAIDYGGRRLGKLRDIQAADTSLIRVPAGITSIDKSAIIVPDGQALPVGGSNDVRGMYAPTDEAAASGANWIGVIERRREAIADHIAYVHCVVPEKITSLRRLTGEDLPRLSATAEIIENHFTKSPNYVSLFDVLDFNLDGWRKFDTHLSPWGTLLVVNSLLKALNLPQQDAPPFTRLEFSVGDLSTRFFDFPIYDAIHHPVEDMYPPEVVFEKPAHRAGGHIGIQMHWRNAGAPIRQRLFVAGNSFAGQGETACDLNWWFSRLFEEVFFDFNPALDQAAVTEFSPDIVITQTIERFLNSVPQT